MYADTSIVLKLLVREADSDSCAKRMEGSFVISSELTRVEVLSALLRKERDGYINEAERGKAWMVFRSMIASGQLSLEPLGGIILERAQDMLWGLERRIPIRTLDSLHLATAASTVSGPVYTADRRMRDAARLLGLDVIE